MELTASTSRTRVPRWKAGGPGGAAKWEIPNHSEAPTRDNGGLTYRSKERKSFADSLVKSG